MRQQTKSDRRQRLAGSFCGPLLVLGITGLTGALERTLIVMALVAFCGMAASLIALRSGKRA